MAFPTSKYSKQINIALTSILVILLIVLVPIAVLTGKDARDDTGDGDDALIDAPTYAPIDDAQECPGVTTADGRAVTSSLGGEPGQKVWIKRSNKLCTLWQVDPSRTTLVPVARSYNGNGWEPYSGDFGGVPIECVAQACGVILPEYVGEGYYFELAAFDHTLPRQDELARFLEQTTFGPTKATLASFPNSFAEWVKDQQSIPLTSHRRYFRERLNHRSEIPSNMGLSTHPCKKGTRYRKYAFTEKDTNPQTILVERSGNNRHIFSRDDQRYTVVDQDITYNNGQRLQNQQ